MSELKILGVTVKFPFTPYDCQRDYMSKVLECLQQKKNGVLESPTGTGKTLCLLCAALAWRENFRDSISARKVSERLKGAELFPDTPLSSWGTAATDGDTNVFYSDVPKIVYASRTHSQLAQVIAELKNTKYRPKVCVLGSREQLCIHPEVQRQESNHVKVHMCRAKVSTRTCSFYNNVEEKSSDRELTESILDIEDLVKYGTKQRACPYYLSRSLKQQADIIFMPYNYLLDPKSRRAHNIELSRAVVIFDEAHNVERTCEESTSFDLTPYDLASAVSAVDQILTEEAKEVSRDSDLSTGLKIDLSTIAKIKQILLDLEAVIDSYDVPEDKGITKPGLFIYELLERAHLNYSTKSAVSEALETISGNLAGQPGVFVNTSGLQKLSDIIQVVFCGDPAEKERPLVMQNNSTHFKVHIHQDQSSKKKSSDPWTSSAQKKPGNVLSYWCFSPGFSMQDLVNQGVRCIILTSGTLSPLSSFTQEMRIDFPVRLENGHVIGRDQIFVSVIERGPDDVQLTSAYDKRFLPENMASLGSTVANLARVVPHGLLVFFPSFPLMEKTLQFWRERGQAERIEKIKPMFVEPKGKGTFSEVIDGFYSKVLDPESKGGSFFAVCRGKASEGLDFADRFGRGVVITGLPFPPMLDPRVVLKMQFLDEMSRQKTPGVKYLSGQEWYRQQAYRAVNQAVGRVIRHKEDYGAIFLCDQRFRGASAISQLPKWLRPFVRSYSSFGNVVRDVSQFFRVAHKLRPVVDTAPPVLRAGTAAGGDRLSCTSTKSETSAKSAKSERSAEDRRTQTQKAKAVDAHIPSLKRRRVEESSGAPGLTELCVRYERGGGGQEMKRPTSLLDALERQETPQEEREECRSPTLSVLWERRAEEEQRGGKRKIKLVQDQRSSDELQAKSGRAQSFLEQMKQSLSKVTFDLLVQTLQTYKKTNRLEELLKETERLGEDPKTHGLLRGFYQFVRPHHKQRFDEQCLRLTGQSCGFKPEHSLSKEERKALTQQQESTAPSSSSSSWCGLLDTRLLNHGGDHLSSETLESSSQLSTALLNHGQGAERNHTQTASSVVSSVVPSSSSVKSDVPSSSSSVKSDVLTSFLSDVKKILGSEKSALLFQAFRKYKTSDDYEELINTAVSLLTETQESFTLLTRFVLFVRPHHKQQYRDLLRSLTGTEAGTETRTGAETKAETESEAGTVPGSEFEARSGTGSGPGLGLTEVSNTNEASSVNASPAVKKQSKISAFFCSSQRK